MTAAPITVGLRPKSVLIVEDNIDVQETLVEIVSEAGLEPVTVSSRRRAIPLVDRRAFDIAVVDKRLVENDSSNTDGLAIVRHIYRKNEGTYLILLTGYGDYNDVTELEDEGVKVDRWMGKGKPSELVEKIGAALEKGARKDPPEYKKGSSSRIFCGSDVPGNWDVGARAFLKSDINLAEMASFLDEFALTCRPLFERPEDNGIQRTGVEGVMAGLYWSRGVGEAVVILLARDHLPPDVPRQETWPPELQTAGVLYQARRKNLIGAIIKCTGVEHTAFTIPRP